MLRTSLATALISVPLAAQIVPDTRTCPTVFEGIYAPGGNLLPFARTRGFIQTWYHGSNMRTLPILELGVRIDTAANAAAMAHTMEITLINTPATFSTLSTTYANNIGTATVFLALKSINLPAVAVPNDPNQPSLWIKGDRPFVFTGPHFIAQFDVRTQTTYGSMPGTYYADSYSMGTAAQHSVKGKSCGPGVLSSSSNGSTWTLTLAGLPGAGPGIFIVGLEPIGPIDLTKSGFTGCSLNVVPLIVVVQPSTSGSAIVNVPYTLAPNTPFNLFAQGAHLDTTKPGGLATTNSTQSLLNSAENTNYLYNFNRDGLTAEYGPYTTNRGAVLLFRP